MDEVLLLLLRHGAHRKPVKITTTQLGAEAGMSQQNASRRLKMLENEGNIERREGGVKITENAREELAGAYATLKQVFERKPVELNGTVVGGTGEGAYYLSLPGYRKQMAEKLGFEPFPGTLNVRIDESDLWKRQYILQLDPVIIKGFEDSKRTYGNLFAYRCGLDGQDCVIVIPLRTHHGSEIIEIISAFGIKKKLKLKDGSRVRIAIQ